MSNGNEEVIEKSSEIKPAWALEDYSGEPKNEVFLVQNRNHLFRLELGIKQAQGAAILATSALLVHRVDHEIRQLAQSLNLKNADGLDNEIQTALAKVKRDFVATDAMARSVYWENVRVETAEGVRTHYNVWILLTAKRNEFDIALGIAGKALLASGNGAAQTLGKNIIVE